MSDGKKAESVTVAEELARLGEEELDSLESNEQLRAEAVRDVEQLFAAVTVLESPTPTLAPWNRHRAWRKIAGGLDRSRLPARRQGVRLDWSTVATLAAVAASAALVLRVANVNQPPDGVPDQAQLRALAEQARASLDLLTGTDGSTRAERLAQEHARLLNGHPRGKESQ